MDILELTDLIRTVTLDNDDEAHRAIDFLRERGILRSEAPLCPRQCRRQMTQALYHLFNAI